MAAAMRSLNPTCEDCPSDDSDAGLNNVRYSSSANVAAKRSHVSDLYSTTPKPTDKAGPDVASDSGYSSHTAATLSSADTAATSAPPLAPPPAASPAVKRRPTVTDDRRNSLVGSPRKPLQRSGSVSSAKRRERREECQEPGCRDCGRARRPQPSPLDSGLDVSYPPFDQRPAAYPPASPSSRRSSYMQETAVVQPARTERRRASAASRPLSFHDPPGYYQQSMPYPPPPQPQHSQMPPQERGPPPAMSAHYSMYGMMGATHPNGFYPLPQPSPYEGQRPQMPARASSQQYSTRRPGYGTPLVTYEQSTSNPAMSARYTPAQAHVAPPREDRMLTSRFESFSEGSDEDRARMPPPKTKVLTTQRRPSVRPDPQVYSTRVTQPQMPRDRDRERERDRDRDRESRPAAPRAPSARRLSLMQQPKAISYDTPPGHVLVEESRSRRRQSYMGHEPQYELEAKHRSAKVYRTEPLPLERRRGQPDMPRDETPLESKARIAEAYQQRTRGEPPQLTEQTLKAVRRNSKVPSAPSDAGSSRSKTSDKGSQSNRASVNANGEIRLRVNPSAGVSLQFNGDMEGRTISLNPADGGMADIVIGGAARGDEAVYHKSVVGRTALVARREGEVPPTTSRRSSRSGREGGDRRSLRRKQYHG